MTTVFFLNHDFAVVFVFSKTEVDLDAFVEVWCEGLWRPGYVRSVDTDSASCDIEFQNGDSTLEVGVREPPPKLTFSCP